MHANIRMGNVSIPHLVEVECDDGFQLQVQERDIPILWPWDLLQWRDSIDMLRCWISDKPELAEMKCLVS